MSTHLPDRGLAGSVVLSAVPGRVRWNPTHGRQDKGADVAAAQVAGCFGVFRPHQYRPGVASTRNANDSNDPTDVVGVKPQEIL
jgi:hypothetical protein